MRKTSQIRDQVNYALKLRALLTCFKNALKLRDQVNSADLKLIHSNFHLVYLTSVTTIKRKFRFFLSKAPNFQDYFRRHLEKSTKFFLHRPIANDLNYPLWKSQFLI